MRNGDHEHVSAGYEAAYVLTPNAAAMLAATGPIIGLFDDDSAFERYRACQAEALTRHAYAYANERLHDDVAALVVKVQPGRAA